jgi:hypothetical protein
MKIIIQDPLGLEKRSGQAPASAKKSLSTMWFIYVVCSNTFYSNISSMKSLRLIHGVLYFLHMLGIL